MTENQVVLTSATIPELVASIVAGLKEREDGKGIAEAQPDEVLSSDDACRLLKITQPTLRSYRDLGYFDVHRLGARTFYLRSELIEGIRNAGKRKRVAR